LVGELPQGGGDGFYVAGDAFYDVGWGEVWRREFWYPGPPVCIVHQTPVKDGWGIWISVIFAVFELL